MHSTKELLVAARTQPAAIQSAVIWQPCALGSSDRSSQIQIKKGRCERCLAGAIRDAIASSVDVMGYCIGGFSVKLNENKVWTTGETAICIRDPN